jgi:hypothetical protein
MLNNADRAALLCQLLTRRIPESSAWQQNRSSVTGPAGEDWESFLIEAPSLAHLGEQRLELEVRPDGDIDVRCHVGAARPSPVEAHFVVEDGSEAETLDEVARFVTDVLAEQIVVVARPGIFGAGLEFLPVAELTPDRRERSVCIVSWRGTYDRRSRSASSHRDPRSGER